MKTAIYSGLWLSIILIILSFSCGKDVKKNPAGPSGDTDTFTIEKVPVLLSIPSESTLQKIDLTIVTFTEEVSIGSKGAISVSIQEAEKNQVVFVTSEKSDYPVYLGIRDPSTNCISIGVNSTALALTMFNPFLFGSDKAMQDAYSLAVLNNKKFDDLLSHLTAAYKSDAGSALDYTANPDIYRLAAELMVEAGGSLGLGVSEKREAYPCPYIEDNTGTIITFGNPTPVWYAAGIYPYGEALTEVVTIPRIEKIISGSPVDIKKDHELGNGYHKICLTKGYDYSKYTRWDDPEGRATVLNTAQAIIYIVETGIGEIPHFNETMAETFPRMVYFPLTEITSINEALASGSAWGFYKALLDLLDENSNGIGLWLWKQNINENSTGTGESAEKYIHYLTGILQRFQILLSTAGLADEEVPFIRDMITAPEEVTYYITQENGDITSWERKFSASGRVLENGSGLSGVSIHISGGDTDSTIVSGTDGKFSLSLLKSGTYTFSITKDEYCFSYSIFKIPISDSDVTLPDIMATKSGGTNGDGNPHVLHGITFVTIPGGSFQMGDVENTGEPDEKPVHFVTLDGFEMSVHEVTNTQYAAYLNTALASGDITASSSGIFGKTGDYSGHKYTEIYEIKLADSESEKSGGNFVFNSEIMNRPVTNVTWFGAKAFALYYGFDLPTEAEWEYAAKGGKQYKYGTDDGTISISKARYSPRGYGSQLSDVCSYPPNPYGLYDMCGNVMEWCDDGYDSKYYSRSPSTNPKCGGGGGFMVLRGGSYRSSEKDCRSAARDFEKPAYGYELRGFRIVRRQ